MNAFVVRLYYQRNETRFKVNNETTLSNILTDYLWREGCPNVSFYLDNKKITQEMASLTMGELGIHSYKTIIVRDVQ